MANGNPFYVSPLGGADIAGSLRGLGQVMETKRKEDRALERQKQAQQAVMSAWKSGDPNVMMEASIMYPEFQDALNKGLGIQEQAATAEAADFSRKLLTAQPEQIPGLYEERISYLQAQNRDPSQTMQSYQSFLQSPDAERANVEMFYAGIDPKGYQAYQDMKADPITYKMGTGDMSGYVFDETTGKFSIDPEVKAVLDQKAAEKAAEGVTLDAKDRQSISKDVTALVKDTAAIYKAAKSLDALKEKGSPAAQLAAVFKFMKALDPTSVVRESEQGMVYNAQGAAQGLAAKLNSVMGKGGLTGRGFDDVVNTAKTLANSAIDASGEEVGVYIDGYEDTIPESFKDNLTKRIPQRFNIQEFSISNEQNKINFPSAPDVGVIESGFKYLGGDPANKENWERI